MTTDSNQRFLVLTSLVKEGSRIRNDYGDLNLLAESIRDNGLLQPIVIKTDNTLVAGCRRLRACRDILKWQEVPVTYFEVADEATLRILEAEENVRRKDMTWQEVVLAVKAVHEAQTVTHSLKGEKWTLDATGYLLGKSQGNVSYCLLLANHINAKDKQILAASSLTEAIRVLLKRKEDEANAILAKMTMPKGTQTADILKADLSKQGSAASIFSDIPSSPVGGVATLSDDGEMPSVEGQAPVEIPLSKMLLHGDCISLMKQMPDACVDHIITDIPYGIDMDNLQQANTGMTDIASVAVEHQVLANHQLHVAMLPEFYRLLKPNGFCIMWFDVGASEQEDSQDQGYLNLRLIATGAGFRCQNWPLVWHKLHRCMNQMAGYNFTKDYELALCCRKGNATLLASQESSVYVGSNDEEAKALGHKFAKPLKLWDWLYRAVVQRGQTVLDPFAGRGSSTISLLRYGASPLAIEKDDNHFSGLVVNVSKEYQKMLKTVKFT